MKITTTDIFTVVVPTIPGTVHSEVYGPAGWDQVPKHIIRLHTDEGYEGYGETGRGCPKEAVESLARALAGQDPREVLWQQIPATAPVEPYPPGSGTRWWEDQAGGPARAGYEAFEMAMFDLLGKIFERPAHWFLGGAVREWVRADYWIGHQTPEDAARNARIAREKGFTGMKMKCTIDEPLVERCQAIWDVAGRDFRLTIDPNTRFYRPAEALGLARELAPRGHVEVFEDPMLKWNLDWYRQFREAGVVPVALHLGGPHEIFQALKAEAVDYLNLGGGMVQFMRNAALAHAASVPVWHGSGNDLGLMEFSYLHAAAAARNCVLASDFVGSWTREDDLLQQGLAFENGYVHVPQSPGLGCELDLDAVEKYRIG
jgi:muconate cycloisomerase